MIFQPTHQQWSLSHQCGTQTVSNLIISDLCLFVVYENGNVCISILHKSDDPMYEHEGDERWRPILGIEAIILSVISMLNDPNIESPANLDASLQFRDSRTEYNKKVRKLTNKSMDYNWFMKLVLIRKRKRLSIH